MASGATQHDSANVSASRSAKLVAYEHFIETQLRKTGNSVKAVDLISALMTMVVAALVYLLAVALLDHWIVPGGLGRGGRFFFLAVLLGAGGFYFARQLLPLLMGRINPLYSAHTIEQSSPTLKNSLLNFLLFRQDRDALPEPVYQALEVQAAKRLSAVQVDAAIDRSKIVRMGYVLLGVVVVYALYMVLSPKSPLASAGRVLMPWAEIQAPSRVTIQHVEPGSAVGSQAILRGGKLTISAEVLGVDPDEPVTLYYTSTDSQAVDRAITMFVPEGALRYECQLPEPDAGLYVDFDYRIEAGDAISTTYHVEVVARPQIVIESVDYEYPKYTRLTDRTVSDQGDLKALEGTRVTVRARANYPIGSAWVDFDADGRSDLAMQTVGDEATASFVLKLSEDRRSAWHTSYALRFSSQQGRRNREPVQHQIEVTPDLSPEITILAPKEEEVEVPLDGEVIIETQAIDPDFALGQITLHGAISGKQVFDFRLLDAEHQGQWVHKYRLVPRRAGLKAGDLVEYWAQAQDNKTPSPNLAKTGRSHRLRIVAPEKSTPSGKPQPKQPQDQPKSAPKDPSPKDQKDPESKKPPEGHEDQSGSQAGEDSKSGEGEQGSGSEGKSGKQDEGQEGEGEGQQSGGSEGKPDGSGQEEGEGSEEGVASDGSDDGGAFQKILKELQEEQGKGEKPSPEQDQQEGSPEGGSEGSPSEGSESGGSEPGQKPAGQDAGEQGTGQPDQSQGGKDSSGKDPSGKDSPSQGKPESGPSESGQEGKPSSKDGAKSESGSEGSDQGKPAAKNSEGSEKPSEGDSLEKDRGEQNSASGESPDDKSAAGEKSDSQGQGSKSKQPGAQPNQKKPGQEEQRPGAKGGDGSNEKGNSGAGKKGTDDAGSPNPEPGTTPNNKKQPGDGSEEGAKDKPKSPAHGNKESNSDGSQGGDKSGGGEEGGGQKADRRGTGSAGQNTASDEGGGQAEESGKGDTSEKSGDDVKSDRSTDDPGKKQTGEGAKQRPGNKPSGSESPDSDQSGEGKSSPRDDSTQGKEGPGRPSAGKPGDKQPSEPRSGDQAPESEPGGDEADLQYARKATDLVLEHLEHDLEKNQVDKDLLDKLGWSQDDLRKFVQRWKSLKQDSRTTGAKGKTARRELDEALRSLGLRSGNVTRRGTRGSDNQRNLRESHRIPPPPGYAEQLKAYRRGLSQTRGTGEND